MLFVLRTTFERPVQAVVGDSDEFLRWLYDTLPTKATMGCDVAVPRWLGNRYPDDKVVVFQIETQYRNEFAAAADQLRIEAAVAEYVPPHPPPHVPAFVLKKPFELMRIYGDAELNGVGDPTKATATHPC